MLDTKQAQQRLLPAQQGATAAAGQAGLQFALVIRDGPEQGAEHLTQPGAFVFLGMGDGPMCHHPAYKFNDNILGHGASYWVRLVEKQMPAG